MKSCVPFISVELDGTFPLLDSVAARTGLFAAMAVSRGDLRVFLVL
jgi:hypothetical protein